MNSREILEAIASDPVLAALSQLEKQGVREATEDYIQRLNTTLLVEYPGKSDGDIVDAIEYKLSQRRQHNHRQAQRREARNG